MIDKNEKKVVIEFDGTVYKSIENKNVLEIQLIRDGNRY